MKTKTINYKFDPEARVLTVYDGQRPKGFFKGDFADEQFTKLVAQGTDITFTDMNSTYSNDHGQKVRKLRAIWIRLGIDKHRDAILEDYHVKSTADLSSRQLDELINFYSIEQHVPTSDRVRSLRSDLLALCNKMGIYTDNGDWSRVNDFFMKKQIAGKLMFQLTEEELVSMRRKLRSIITKNLEQAAETARKERLN